MRRRQLRVRLPAALAGLIACVLLFPAAAVAQEPLLPYLNPELPVQERAADLLARLTLDEKLGQLLLIDVARLMGEGEWDRGPLNPDWVERTLGDAQVGALLSGGGAAPVPNTPENWAAFTAELATETQRLSISGIPLIYGVDAVHGHNNVLGAMIYPQQIGLAASWDPQLVAEVARRTAGDVAGTGVHWNFAPVADLGRDPRWGRFYETFGEDPLLAATLVAAHVQAQQQVPGIAATLKYFIGYGAAADGRDRGPAEVSQRQLRQTLLPPFTAGIEAGARTVMVNSGALNGVPGHASRELLTGLLRGELGFTGVIVSDWADVEKLATVHRVAADLDAAVALALNAGVDVIMVPHDAAGHLAALQRTAEAGRIPPERVDEAVLRVLELKFGLGLFDLTAGAPAAGMVVHDDSELAHRAAAASLTLLENDGLLPFGPEVQRIVVTGPAARDAGMQLGGWTIGWQGVEDELPPVVTFYDGLLAGAPESVTVEYLAEDDPGLLAAAAAADAVIAFLGEWPYAEGLGDRPEALLPAAQAALIERLDASATPLLTVLVTGRPLILPDGLLRNSQALLMAYLPGSEGGTAVADAVFGRAAPAGRLPFTWPASTGQLPLNYDTPPSEAGSQPLYEFGYGLGYGRVDYRKLTAEVDTAAGTVAVTVQLGLSAELAVDEVVQVFASYPPAPVLAPARQLAAFERVRLEPGETREVTLLIPLERLQLWTGDAFGSGEARLFPGRYRLEAGGITAVFELETY